MTCKKRHRRRHRAGLCAAAALAAAPAAAHADLPASVVEAMDLALADERQAHRTYTDILEAFGEVRPFSNIVHAEARHIEALLPLYSAYRVPVPADDSTDDPDVATLSLKALCEKGVAAEIENVRLYDEELLPAVSAYPDITVVFTNLRNASADRHLPAFQRCVDRGGQPGRGYRGGRS